MGKIIVIEGIEGSGKETQSKLLVESLNRMGIKAIEFSFPMYDTPTGRIFKDCLLNNNNYFNEGIDSLDPELVCLYTAADRKYNINKIKEYLDNDYIVVINRYTSSNMANQGSKYSDSEDRFYMYQWIDKLEYWLLKLPKPDYTILLNMPYKYSNQLSFDLTEEDSKQTRVLEAYLELAGLYNWDIIDCIDENKEKTIDEIHKEIIELLKDKGIK
ncbi:MAG TPA: hypothetical protein IAB38_05630 [Candidatus Onthousia excrementipullorum]|uniref:Thymidylate kinase n=1 Tax=Candidatus Onthousia excrementipullorum TaxID=2840884 RepID=A0A9D1J3N8_9FIRM|nr:hypothetical protein [Candidatus Onthousia excrementipullorum]